MKDPQPSGRMHLRSSQVRVAILLAVLFTLGSFVVWKVNARGQNPSDPLKTAKPHAPLAGNVQFSNATYGGGEGDGSVLITVTRTGDTSGPATVDFASSDGSALQTRDYILATGTLSFAAGETSKTFRVLIVDDVYVEANESVNLNLSNPTSGAVLGNPSSAVLTIADNDSTPPTSNPIDQASFFVTQHYFAFLSRLPDAGGLDFWTGQITQCGSDEACVRTQRITVSNAFYFELEFHQTATYVYRLYRESFGNNQPFPNPNPDSQYPGEDMKIPAYLQIMTDRERVRGGANLAQKQLDLANAFVQRPEFTSKYPPALGGPEFVDAVLATINSDIGTNLSSQRAGLISLFNTGGRGAVIYRLADDNPSANPINNQAFIDAEYNRAFAATLFFGYLRRDPNIAAFLLRLGQLNGSPLRDLSMQRALVCLFMNSTEYQQRFSSVTPHSESECPVPQQAPSGLTYATNPATYVIGQPITANTPSSSGGAVTSYSIGPALSAGLNFNTTTGVISGTPTVLSPTRNYTVTATNGSGSTNATVTITVVTAVNISGRVADVTGTGIGGISVNVSGSATLSTSTDSSGNYLFPTLASGGNFTVTPSNANFSFSPASQSFNNQAVNRIANFVATQSVVSISGKVTDANNAGLNNVTVALVKNGTAAGTVQTDGLGNYSFGNLAIGANYVVMPTGGFTPLSQTLGNLTVNATANFRAAPSLPPQCPAVNFAAPTTVLAGANARFVAIGDFNNDGKSDLAVANEGADNVSILLGTGTGSFSAATNFAVGSSPQCVAIGDFNSDGKSDLAVANLTFGNVSILLGAGTGSFGAATNFAVSANPRFVAVGEFNNDGKSDLAVAASGAESVSILLGTGSGSFGAPTDFLASVHPQSVAIADFNSDGQSDLAVANGDSNNVSILLGTGTGSFGPPTSIAVGGGPLPVAVGDFNNDGKTDLAVARSGGSGVAILLGTGTGNFGAPTIFPLGNRPFSLAIGDFNGDSKSDLAVADFALVNASIALGTGTGSFGASADFAVGGGPQSVAISDFNGDDKIDLAVADHNSNKVSILINNGGTCNTQNSLTISGRLSNTANGSIADAAVTLSGPVTRVATTDAAGNYSFANLTPGGNYAVTVQSNYFVVAPSRADFFNLSSDQTANFVAAPLAVPSPTPTPNDDFTSMVRDASKWSLGVGSQSAAAFDPLVTTAQVNGQLVITPLTQATGLHYDGYVSANSFDLRNGSAKVEVVKAATGGADTIFAVGTDADNFYRFMVHTTGTTTSLAPRAKGRDGIERPLDTTVAQLVFQVNVGGQLTSLSIDYNPALHRFMRFRHVPPANSIVFETSPDNVDFTVQHTVVLQKSVSALTAELSAGTSNPTNPGQTVFDNFGLVTSTFQFSAGSYSVGEGDGSILVTVTRAGSLADTASVDFATADGTARQKSRYTSAAGTLAFASGIASRTFRVLLVDNQLAEGEQTLNLLLSNPVGSGLNTPGRAVLTIVDNDSTLATTNSLDDARYFVTQHYYDFLSRVPDQSGLDFWVSQITLCGTDEACLRTQRITVSNAFFYEQEYQQTGSYVVRVYRAAYGNNQPIPNNDANPQFPNENKKLVNYSAFSPDRARVRGGPSLAQTQLDLANAFVLRPQFLARYPASLDGPAFVDAMLATINTDIGVNLTSQRTALIDLFNQGGRGQVLYRLADDNATNPIANQAFLDAEYNRAFVLTQYFGYLRRNPDVGGFVFWLGQVNSTPLRSLVKQRAMVCSFITSLEYQQRFSPVATHNNTECQ